MSGVGAKRGSRDQGAQVVFTAHLTNIPIPITFCVFGASTMHNRVRELCTICSVPQQTFNHFGEPVARFSSTSRGLCFQDTLCDKAELIQKLCVSNRVRTCSVLKRTSQDIFMCHWKTAALFWLQVELANCE